MGSIARGVIDETTLDEIEETIKRQRDQQERIDRCVDGHILDALAVAQERWDAEYAFLYVYMQMEALERQYRRILSGKEEPAYGSIRRAIPRVVRTYVMERDLYRCKECGTHLRLTVDHIIPVARGGTNDPDNLQTLCLSCNCRKGAQV